ncbi:MAG: outer membrane beta-barrel protein [Cyclobacteriaceae bacterium]|nr:MAG: outer membrane beta-barrel protein [Cyclobacteriaceae bacterium]
MQYKIIVGFILLLAVFTSAFAQNNRMDCEQTLSLATEEFNAGRFYGIPALLKPCIDRGFGREQRQRAYLLLAQTYLILDDPISAENSYLEILRANPEFEADTALHPIDLVYLSKKFTADPIFSLFLKLGGNTSPVRVIHTINPWGSEISNDYKLRLGVQVGGGVDWNITRELALTAEFNALTASYRKNQIRASGDEFLYVGNQFWFMTPISVRFSDTKGNLRPYGYGGFALQWLVSERGRVTSIKTDIINEGTPQSNTRESPALTMTDFRNKVNYSFFVGGGVRYKRGLDYVFADVRYSFGLSNIVVPTSTYGQQTPAIEFGHVDDLFRIDNLALSIGYVRPLYKPRKLKKARTRSVLKLINRGAK